MTSPDVRPYLWNLCGSAWFTAMTLLVAAVKGACDWQTVAVVRSGLATLFALALALGTRTKLVFPGTPTLWLRSVAGSLSMVATFYALGHLPPSNVLLITNSFPVWVALLSWPIDREKPTPGVWIAVVSAVVGVSMIQMLGDHSPADPGAPVQSREEILKAYAAALSASIFTAVAMMGLNRLKGVASLAVVTHFSAVSLVACGLSFFAFPRDVGNDRLTEWPVLLELLAMGGCATIGQIFLTKAFRGGVATKVSVVGLSQVVMVMLWEAVVNHRAFNAWELGGAALVLGPTAYLMARERRTPGGPKADDEPTIPQAVME